MIVREEETLRKTAVFQIVCEELFIRSIEMCIRDSSCCSSKVSLFSGSE